MKEYTDIALNVASAVGASFADMRIVEERQTRVFVQRRSLKLIDETESFGYSVRVLLNGAWGFASSTILGRQEVADTANLAVEAARAAATRAALDRRAMSSFAGCLGRKLLSEKVRLTTRLDDPELPARAFGQDGLPARETTWIEGGEVRRLRHDRYWADRQDTEPDPSLYPLFMDGEDRSIDDLIGLCSRGLLVKRLWYIRYVDRRQLLLTGMTRDGLFLIENGAVSDPVQNLRFNESPVVFLSNIAALSRAERIGQVKVPGVLSEGFTFSSTTESV